MFQLYLMSLILIKSVVHGNGRGTHLGTSLVYPACVVAFVACVTGDKFSVMCLILLQSVVHGHGRGTHLGTCLVYAVRVVVFVACMTGHGLCCPRSLYANNTTYLCDMKQQSCVSNSREQSRSSIKKVSNKKNNFSHINIFVRDDHANYL